MEQTRLVLRMIKELVFALFVGFGVLAMATPEQIVIIRHGEKIDDSFPDLSPQGCERANGYRQHSKRH